VHRLRRLFPAIAVSADTALADNPRLTARGDEGETCPVRFVLDRHFKTAGRTGLNLFQDAHRTRTIVVGLGAAANVLTVLRSLTEVPARVRIESFDHTAAPLKFALTHASELGYVVGFEDPVRNLLAHGETRFQVGACEISWRFHEADFPTWLASPDTTSVPGPDAILFDAFSPARNPAMWSLGIFRGLRQRVPQDAGGTLATYSRSTLLRVTLLLAGFHVGAGEATGEKEETTFAAADPSLVTRPLDATWLGRAIRSTSAEPLHESVYRQCPLSEESRKALESHPQFKFSVPGAGRVT